MFEEAEKEEEEERLVSPEPDVELPPAAGQSLPQEESTPTAPSEQQEVDKRSLTKVCSNRIKVFISRTGSLESVYIFLMLNL